jgi:FKBP-type peptidyl-prolyl cis-trans isomerase
MARKRERVFALTMAALFLVTSAAFSIVVIWQMIDQNKQNKDSESANTSAQQNTADSKKLQGTKLAGFEPVKSIPKLETTDTKEGSGQTVKPGDTVTVNYTGAVAATGVIFQSSLDTGQPVSFPLTNVIKGWQEGIPGMKVGGERRLMIPAAMAYGSTPPQGSGIPANADLVFDVTLIKIGSN